MSARKFRSIRWLAANGTPLRMRLARPSDTPQVKAGLDTLSREARRNRFFAPMPQFSDPFVKKFTEVDPAREHLLFVMRRENESGLEIPVGGGRIVISNDEFTGLPTRCDFSLIVGDAWQRQGIARRILKALIDEAIRRKLQQMNGQILATNEAMLALARAFGFKIEPSDEDGVKEAILYLPQRRNSGWKKLLLHW